MCGAAYRSWTARSWKKPHANVIELSKTSSIVYLDNRGALLTAVHQWLTSSIYSQRCYYRGATVFFFHPFLRSQHTTNRFFRKIQDNASVLKKHFEPRSFGCLWEINRPECKPRDEVKDPRTDRGVAHRLNCFCIACSVVRVGPRIIELVMSLLDGHLERYVGHYVFLELQPVFGSNQTTIFL